MADGATAGRRGWWARLFGGGYRPVEAVGALAEGARVELSGRAEAIEPLVDPVSGERGVAVHVRARIAGAVARAYGGPAGTSMAYETSCQEMVDFVLRDDSGGALIRVTRGGDVHAFVDELVRAHGLEASTDSELIPVGARVTVRGRVESVSTGHGPHRGGPYDAVVVADDVVLAG